MRQRNDSGHVVDVAAYPTEKHPEWRPFAVGPGEVVDFPEPLGGFTPLETEADAPGGEVADAVADEAPSKPARKRAASAPAPEGAEA